MDERINKGGLAWSNPYGQTYIYNLLQLKQIKEAEEFVKKHPDYRATLQYYQRQMAIAH